MRYLLLIEYHDDVRHEEFMSATAAVDRFIERDAKSDAGLELGVFLPFSVDDEIIQFLLGSRANAEKTLEKLVRKRIERGDE
jgi:hypothetical protein